MPSNYDYDDDFIEKTESASGDDYGWGWWAWIVLLVLILAAMAVLIRRRRPRRPSQTIQSQVIRTEDGDTLTVINDREPRYRGERIGGYEFGTTWR